MELDELKSTWAQYDKNLTNNLQFNENLLRKINLDKSKREMNAPLNLEIVSVVLSGLLLLYVIFATYKNATEIKYLIPGLFTAIILLTFLILSIRKLNLLSNIDYYNSPVVELQKSLENVKKKYLKVKKVEFYIAPLVVIASAPILAKAIHNEDIYEQLGRFIIIIIGSLGLGYPIAIWIYKNWYDKKLKNTASFLEELNKFEKED